MQQDTLEGVIHLLFYTAISYLRTLYLYFSVFSMYYYNYQTKTLLSLSGWYSLQGKCH